MSAHTSWRHPFLFYIGLTVTTFMSEQNEKTVADTMDDEQIQQIKDATGKNYNFTELHINRVPDRAVDQLQELAYDMFAGDYGATLAYLLELHELRQEFDQKLVATNRKVVELEDQLIKITTAMSSENQEENDSKKPDTLQ